MIVAWKLKGELWITLRLVTIFYTGVYKNKLFSILILASTMNYDSTVLGKKRRKFDRNYQRKGLVKGKFVRISTSPYKKASYSKGILPILKVKKKNSLYSKWHF